MRKLYVLEIHTTERTRYKDPPYQFQPYKTYWKYTGPRRVIQRLERKMYLLGWRTVVYEEKYARSETYRQDFFAENKTEDGVYRCSYCGRKMKRRDVNVDHIVPVGAVKKSRRARRLLHGRGVNDVTNLTASCAKCNMRKGAKFGRRWIWKARIGEAFPQIYTIRRIVLGALLAAVLLCVVWAVKNPDAWHQCVREAERFIAALIRKAIR